MRKIYCLIVLSLLTNVSTSFSMDEEEKDQEYPIQQHLHPVQPPLSYNKWQRYDATWKFEGDVSPIVAPPPTPIYTSLSTTEEVMEVLDLLRKVKI